MKTVHNIHSNHSSKLLLLEHLPELVLDCPMLDIVYTFVELIGQRSCAFALFDRKIVLDLLVENPFDGADRGSGPAAEHLQDALLFERGQDLSDRILALDHLAVLNLAENIDRRFSRDAREDQAVQRARDNLLFAILVDPVDENVHRPDLGDARS